MQPRSYSIIVFSRGCRPHLPLSAALFLSQRGFSCLLPISHRAHTSPNEMAKEAGIPLALFSKSRRELLTVAPDIMTPTAGAQISMHILATFVLHLML